MNQNVFFIQSSHERTAALRVGKINKRLRERSAKQETNDDLIREVSIRRIHIPAVQAHLR